MTDDVKFVRRWEYDGQEFKTKREVAEYRSRQELAKFDTIDALISNADEVVALLKPFVTPKRRKTRDNGARKGSPRPGVKRDEATV